MTQKARGYIIQDLIIIALSIVVAIVLVKTQLIVHFLESTKQYEFLGSFVAGVFFTSIFTTAPAIVALGEIAQMQNTFFVAFFGALGALLGDVIIFRFIRDNLSEHLTEIMKHQIEDKAMHFKHHLKFFRWVTFFVGGIIIASPLPDEIGIGLLGLSKMNMRWFIPIAFIGNFFGIVLIGIIANSL